ncbi:hypothetical protein COK37_21150 [Bacillus thuringiensis]|uniref:hypothetical protein n=1 Tax=Bacillus thuringiensis TaxID=1428 RepID=UPI000BF78326|nr:hypothetical protein [Bacillus thuringiensis]PEV50732.1 hypothetical protein CN432_08960 [Bacillus thuringiensis]PFR65852.1 hypothetical protein COK37_21150 [Bacillus thuringiensis]PFT77451.1 hypothetical protein COK70_19925 [Bacillus thuringiensis]PFV87904.1 hypothetical protein COL06_15000 [Bacillus thuringiensis]
MLNDKIELQLKILTTPFNEYSFYKDDIIEEYFKGGEFNGEDREIYFKKLLKIIYPIITRNNRVNNLDEVKLLTKKYYFPNWDLTRESLAGNNTSILYINLLNELSRVFITHRNGKISLKYWESTEEENILGPYKGIYKVALWNSLNRIFTTDILVIIYLLDNGMVDERYLKGYHSHVSLEDIELNQVLQKGISETHMHFSAGGNFTLNWQTSMSPTRRYISQSVENNFLYTNELIGADFNLYKYTLAMASLRLLLGNFLKERQNPLSNELNLDKFYNLFFNKIPINENEAISTLSFLNSIAKGEELTRGSEYYFNIYEGVKDILNLELMIPSENLKWNTYLAVKDILHSVIDSYGEYTTVENIFLFRCLRYMKLTNKKDALFHKLFWQYLRIKNERFKLEIQKNNIKGLEYFKPYIERATDTVEIDESDVGKWGLILHTIVHKSSIKKLELRITVGKGNTINEKINSLVKKLKSFFKAYEQVINDFILEGRLAPQIGIIIHFIKEEDTSLGSNCWNDDEKKGYFYDLQYRYHMEMEAINMLRESVPGLADYLIGIDAANLETNTEPWVFAPIYKKARNSDSHKLVYYNNPVKVIRNLGFTYHVGEDFRHMITGLRHIDEVIEHFQYRSGDRIGHGIVLGVSAINWANKHKVVVLPQNEYLDNMLWVWGLNREHNLKMHIENLELKILKVAEQVYSTLDGLNVYKLWKNYKEKFSDSKLKNESLTEKCSKIKCPVVNQETTRWDLNTLHYAQNCSYYNEKLSKPIQIEINDEEITIIKIIQEFIKNKISREGIVVETNPSSNIAIGELENIFEHYIHNLNSVNPESDSIKVTINTDDPIVFNTNISNEYAYIFYSLIEKGFSREQAILWIDKIRDNGMTSSFIETKNVDNFNLLAEIKSILDFLNEF